MSDKKTKIPRKLSNQQVIITKFVDPVMFKNKGFWPKEMKIANSLVKKYNLDFLKWVIPPYGKKVPSLAYFIADYGQQYLQEQYFNFNKSKLDLSPKIEKVELSKDKIGEDVVINKPKTLKDFLNLFQTT
jgi:hypothetical protein